MTGGIDAVVDGDDAAAARGRAPRDEETGTPLQSPADACQANRHIRRS
jgi:hypothetical protein